MDGTEGLGRWLDFMTFLILLVIQTKNSTPKGNLSEFGHPFNFCPVSPELYYLCAAIVFYGRASSNSITPDWFFSTQLNISSKGTPGICNYFHLVGHDCWKLSYRYEKVYLFCSIMMCHNCSYHGLRTHDGQFPNSLRPKFKFKIKSQSQINIWYLDI